MRWALPLEMAWAPIPGAEAWLSVRPGVNSGAAFGLFQGAGAVFVFAAVAVILAILGLYLTQHSMTRPVAIALGLISGGAAGNLLDRLRFGGALDFLRVGPLPAFNLADVCLLIGAAALLLWALRRR